MSSSTIRKFFEQEENNSYKLESVQEDLNSEYPSTKGQLTTKRKSKMTQSGDFETNENKEEEEFSESKFINLDNSENNNKEIPKKDFSKNNKNNKNKENEERKDKKEKKEENEENVEKKEEEKKEEKKEEKREENNEEITNDYIFRCEKCLLVPIIKIDHKTYKIHIQCENNHIKSDINIAKAFNDREKISFKKCLNCGENSEEDNFICIQCLKVFCLDGGCKKKHSKENPTHKLIDVKTYDSTCLEHLTSFSKYCNNCKKNICVKCQNTKHKGHSLVDLGEILPSNEDIEAGKKLYEEKKEKLSKLKTSINEWLKDFIQKVNELTASIDAEILINKNILKNFKPDLYNYQMIQNFNYFSSKKSVESFTNNELLGFDREQTWFPKTVIFTQALAQQQQPMIIDDSDNNKKKMKIKIKTLV